MARAKDKKGKSKVKGNGEKGKGPWGKGKHHAKGKQTEKRKLGPCYWHGRDGRLVAGCWCKQQCEQGRSRPTSQVKDNTSTAPPNSSASSNHMRVDDKGFSDQQNNVTQQSKCAFSSVEVHLHNSGVGEEYRPYRVLDLTSQDYMLKKLAA